MSPRIRRDDGSTIWAGEEATPDFAIEQGIVAYARDMESAVRHSRAGRNPLIIRAIARHDNAFRSDPILAEEDADLLLTRARRDGFLKRFNVVILID